MCLSEDSLFWKCTRGLVFSLVSRSVRKVLSTRQIESVRRERVRWLDSDVQRFLAATSSIASDLRPIAQMTKLPSVGNRLMVELTVFTIAAYRAMLRFEVDPKEAREIIADVGWDVYSWLLSWSSMPFRLTYRDAGKRLQRTIGLLLRFPFNAPGAPGYAVERWQEGDNLFTHFTHCPPQSFVRAIIEEQGDCGDLDAFYHSWCLYDFSGADVIAGDGRRGHYTRKKTLSRGDQVCDMCWAGKAKEGSSAH